MPLPPVNTQGPIALTTPAPIHVRRYVRNGLVPHAVFETELGGALNFAAACRTKNLFTWCVPLASIPGSEPGSSRVRWRFAGHTSPLLRRIRAIVYMATLNSDAANPSVTLYITNADGSTVYGSGTHKFGNNQAGATVNDTPSEFSYGEIVISGVPADTTIYGRFEDNDGGRLISATVFEESLKVNPTNGYPQSNVSVGGPIYDDRREDLYTLATTMWKRQASPLLHWTVDNQSSPRSRSAATYVNLVDDSSTTVSSSTPGWTLDTRYCRTLAQSTVPCVLRAYGSMTGGASGTLRLVDSTGATVASISSFTTTDAWQSTTLNLPAALDKYDLQYASNGLQFLRIGAVSLYQYAT